MGEEKYGLADVWEEVWFGWWASTRLHGVLELIWIINFIRFELTMKEGEMGGGGLGGGAGSHILNDQILVNVKIKEMVRRKQEGFGFNSH
jgi:hypothetical protein